MMGSLARDDVDLNYYCYDVLFKVGTLLSVVDTRYGKQCSYKDHFFIILIWKMFSASPKSLEHKSSFPLRMTLL